VHDLWLPGSTAPTDEFVGGLHRQIQRFANRAGIERAFVEVELADGQRFPLDTIAPEPGFGFVTLRPHRDLGDEDSDELPEELVVPMNAIRRVELSRAEEHRERFGFSLPESA
jgi:hypothetical protein